MTDPRYPIGPWRAPDPIDAAAIEDAIAAIESLPDEIEAALAEIPQTALDQPYRPGAWTVRQLVHHVADSHLNAYCRHRLTLTEEDPTIRAYSQEAWADLADARDADLEPSLAILRGLHARWARLLRSLPVGAFARRFRHPERPGAVWTLGESVCMYGWHGRHHVAHVRAAAPPS